ncbi:hypothetical protein SB461_00660 [Burkholderia cenocepacia]|uniref:hypothetical protein n=1 Tax=Burkholderia cenocepacia TaxID=95486 RepID=UPI002B249AE8|nr:hypothetical protein [Burkholderia cenocepacia]MEB2605018.1 hypothetical protein [Burkholderia cenocepacia]
MPLRQAIIAEIYHALDSSDFTSADFEVRTAFSSSGTLLEVVFRSFNEYRFVVKEEVDYNGTVTQVYAQRIPGLERDSDIVDVESLSKLPAMLKVWTKAVRSELRATLPVYSELDVLRQRVEEHIREHVVNPDERFSQEEADELRVKLNELAQRFEELHEKNELSAQQLKKMEAQIEVLTDDLQGFRRGTWYRTAATKLWSLATLVASSPEGRKVLTQAAQKAIGVDTAPDQ